MAQHCGTPCNRNNSNDDFSGNIFSVTTLPPSRSNNDVSEEDKAGVSLLFSGIFLGLIGLAFTVMGWMNYKFSKSSKSFEWTQFLGPILLSVGVMFMLVGICKFKMLTCKICKHRDVRSSEEGLAQPGQSFVITSINQPLTFHGARVAQCVPPPYAHVTCERGAADNIQARGILSGVSQTTRPPQYCSIYPFGNPLAGDDHCPPSHRLDNRDVGNHKSEMRAGGKATVDGALSSSAPPAYDDIFPVPLLGDST